MPPKGCRPSRYSRRTPHFCRTDCSSPICKSVTSFLLLSIPLLSVSPCIFQDSYTALSPLQKVPPGFRRTSPGNIPPCLAARQPCPPKINSTDRFPLHNGHRSGCNYSHIFGTSQDNGHFLQEQNPQCTSCHLCAARSHQHTF